MQDKLITKDKVFIQDTNFSDVLYKSSGYEDFHTNLVKSNIEFDENKAYDLLPSGFIDFNQHLYEDINHMNSISSGLFLEKTLITFRIFIWTSRGEGFEIFKHVLRGSEINKLKSKDDVIEYIYNHLSELEDGIINTYGNDIIKSFEEFGKGIESKKLPLSILLNNLTIDNNLCDFR